MQHNISSLLRHCTYRTVTNGSPSLVPSSVYAPSTDAFSMDAGDLMELQLMNLRINDGRYDGSGNTSAGFRRTHEPDQPQSLLALPAPITLPSHEATVTAHQLDHLCAQDASATFMLASIIDVRPSCAAWLAEGSAAAL